MFVRLFVDENLDRMVPISKQPKEKIQAIIESCSRQFPEFQERSRKRIRTYLKSCRRMKKGGFELLWRHQGSLLPAQLLPKTNFTPTEASTTTYGDMGLLPAPSRALVLHKLTVSSDQYKKHCPGEAGDKVSSEESGNAESLVVMVIPDFSGAQGDESSASVF
ncbi:hypothetical protein XENOCAPTIV_025069 [Xenoophorus captivus]|uniref:Nucleolar protein 4 helical domain-containing protein n=1 Tax=Xenoophorus captivus TaxID=1517983 RepID=A0ABV0RN95_9TELE